VADLAATVIFVVFRPFKRGELIRTLDHLGTVREILLFNTVLMLPDHRLVTLANGRIKEEGVTNYSRIGMIRAEINFLVPYEADFAQIERLLTEVADQEQGVLADPPPEITIVELAEFGLRVGFAPAIRPEDFLRLTSALRLAIARVFQTEGITFAVPGGRAGFRRVWARREDTSPGGAAGEDAS
jgi:small conductance mechanosensitive channel